MLKVVKPDHYSKKEKRKEYFQEKQLHGQFWTNTAEVRDKKTWKGLKKMQTKEGDGGYNYGSTRPSIKK